MAIRRLIIHLVLHFAWTHAHIHMSSVRGWIYVLANRAMPGLVKVGFSMKDPTLRAQELQGTGIPHPFLVTYEALVHDPQDLEQRVHRRLSAHREAKEFFVCDPLTAVNAIRAEAEAILLENDYTPSDVRTTGTHPNQSQSQANASNTESTHSRSFQGRRRNYSSSQVKVKDEPSIPRRRFSANYSGNCQACNAPFSVTVTHHDRGTHCPHCHKYNNLTEFVQLNLESE